MSRREWWTLFRFERNAELGSTRLAVTFRARADPAIDAAFVQKVGVIDPLARYARVSPSRGGEYSSRHARVNPLLVRRGGPRSGRGGRSHRLSMQSRLTLGTSMIRFVILKQVSRGRNAWRTLAHLDIAPKDEEDLVELLSHHKSK